MRRIFLLAFLAICIGTVGCSADDVTDQVSDIVQAEDEHILGVKNAHPSKYPEQTYGEAFDSFFGSPTWKYFVGTKEAPDDDGDGKPDSSEENVDIVEFTGYCTYQEVQVKALLQFTLDKEGDTFSPTYLSFNEVPQNYFTIATLIETVFNNNSNAAVEQTTENITENTSTEENVLTEEQEEIVNDADTGFIKPEDLAGYYVGEQNNLDINIYSSPDGDEIGNWSYADDSGYIVAIEDGNYLLCGEYYTLVLAPQKDGDQIVVELWSETGGELWETLTMTEHYES